MTKHPHVCTGHRAVSPSHILVKCHMSFASMQPCNSGFHITSLASRGERWESSTCRRYWLPCIWMLTEHRLSQVLIRMHSTRLRFNMGFWGFTFPLGVFTSGTVALADAIPSALFAYLSLVQLAVLVSRTQHETIRETDVLRHSRKLTCASRIGWSLGSCAAPKCSLWAMTLLGPFHVGGARSGVRGAGQTPHAGSRQGARSILHAASHDVTYGFQRCRMHSSAIFGWQPQTPTWSLDNQAQSL